MNTSDHKDHTKSSCKFHFIRTIWRLLQSFLLRCRKGFLMSLDFNIYTLTLDHISPLKYKKVNMQNWQKSYNHNNSERILVMISAFFFTIFIEQTQVMMCMNDILTHNEEYFPDPNTFRPERWLRDNVRQINAFAVLPFGFGARNCLGQRFAKQMIHIAIVKVKCSLKLKWTNK